ncbi:hypothetical protein BpHYR1_009722 [Brachionus plicatilis]|uniref:Uncharacterized protein n=1 Tax=Brachionus plicatilis TaxID=10195 RepID=A0A3M7Q8Y9_BRAPC|nr:hypothetical protein BpHYR1_009722 [Brachionus plicatilis]
MEIESSWYKLSSTKCYSDSNPSLVSSLSPSSQLSSTSFESSLGDKMDKQSRLSPSSRPSESDHKSPQNQSLTTQAIKNPKPVHPGQYFSDESLATVNGNILKQYGLQNLINNSNQAYQMANNVADLYPNTQPTGVQNLHQNSAHFSYHQNQSQHFANQFHQQSQINFANANNEINSDESDDDRNRFKNSNSTTVEGTISVFFNRNLGTTVDKDNKFFYESIFTITAKFLLIKKIKSQYHKIKLSVQNEVFGN